MNTVHNYMALAGELSEEHASKAIEIAARFILQRYTSVQLESLLHENSHWTRLRCP